MAGSPYRHRIAIDVRGKHVSDDNKFPVTGSFTADQVDPTKSTSTAIGTAISASQIALAALANMRLSGFAATEAGSPSSGLASFRLRHGTLVTSPILVPLIKLGKNESVRDVLPDLDAPNGVYLEMVSGTIELNLFHRTVT